MFTGRLPHQHGFHSATPQFDELPREETFLSRLPDHRLVGISANPYASPIFGFDALFDDFHHITSSTLYLDGLSASEFWHKSSADGLKRYLEFLTECANHDHPLKSLANGMGSQAEKLLRKLPVAKPFDGGCKRLLNRTRRALELSDEPTFVFVNIMDAHGPLTNVREYDQSLLSRRTRRAAPGLNPLEINLDESFEEYEREINAYRELYAAAVEYVARQTVEFCRTLNEDTAVVITSDHGEQLLDDKHEKRFGHVTPDMTEPLLHVPLELINAQLDIDESEMISHLDLGRIITSIARGNSFEKDSPVAAEAVGLGVAHPPTDHERFDYWNRTARCVYLDNNKYVWDSKGSAKYYKRVDGSFVPKQESDVDMPPNEAKVYFKSKISEVENGISTSRTAIDEDVESQLEELGYL